MVGLATTSSLHTAWNGFPSKNAYPSSAIFSLSSSEESSLEDIMALDLILPFIEGGRRSGLGCRKNVKHNDRSVKSLTRARTSYHTGPVPQPSQHTATQAAGAAEGHAPLGPACPHQWGTGQQCSNSPPSSSLLSEDGAFSVWGHFLSLRHQTLLLLLEVLNSKQRESVRNHSSRL